MAKKGLGKGLGALISAAGEQDGAESTGGVIEIDINQIEPNRDQPRKAFDDDSLRGLAASIREYGIIQPLIVTQEDGYYSIAAGERRWRAARMAGLSSLPVVVKTYTSEDLLQVALIENLQREDLNPIEEAVCYRRLTDEYFFTQEAIAEKIGKSRNSVSYALALLNLDERVQNFIVEGKLTAGHGRHLLAVKQAESQFELAETAIENEATVRETEKLVKDFLNKEKFQKSSGKKEKNAEFTRLERDLSRALGTKVNIKDGKTKGKIEIEYYTPEELDRLLGILNR